MFVYVGKVIDVRGDGTDIEADIEIEEVEDELLPVSEDVETVRYRRPEQFSPMSVGERVRVWAINDAEGRLQLLEPNGWERLS